MGLTERVGREPLRGNVGVARASWSYSNTERFIGSVGPERGFTIGASVDVGPSSRPCAMNKSFVLPRLPGVRPAVRMGASR